MLSTMKRGAWADDLTAIRDASLDGVIRARTLEQLGVAKSTVWSRCRPEGPWQRILPGVVLLHNGRPSTTQRYLAALTYGGPDCLLSGYAALDVAGYSTADRNDVLLLVPAQQHRRAVSFVDVERTCRMPDGLRRGHLRYAPPSRSLIDVARRLSSADRCRAVLTSGLQRGDVTVDQLARELGDGPNRGSGLPRSIVRELGDDAHSVAELQAQKLYASSGLPRMVHNEDVFGASGEWIARPDGWLDEVALAWEIDSLRYHFTAEAHAATLQRRARMQRAGIVVVSTLPRQLTSDPRTVLADLRAAYRLACVRPRPAVFLREAA